MSETLVLAKRELWFVEKVVNEVEVRVPSCRSSTCLDFDEVFKAFEILQTLQRQAQSSSVDGVSAGSGVGWDDAEVVGIQLKEKAKEEIVESRQVDRQDVPDDWVDATD